MYLTHIAILGFKNCRQAELTFSKKFNCFYGNNGMGKTNMLDAIYYLSFCKSFYSTFDTQHIRKGDAFFMIQGNYVDENANDKTMEVFCGLKRNEKKQFKRNKKEYSRLSDHIGLIPLVMIAPEDAELIHGGSEIRRRFMDGVIAQYDKTYLEQLLHYNRALLQRNALLKVFAEKRHVDSDALEVYDSQLCDSGTYIARARKEFYTAYNPVFDGMYRQLSEQTEQVSLTLQTMLEHQTMPELLKATRDRDVMLQYTTAGIHKDDLSFELDGEPVKKFASQGQQKTFLLALKLAQYRFMAQIKQTHPILLLDDIYDKLDKHRLHRLIALIAQNDFGQVFITDTQKERMAAALTETGKEAFYFPIQEGAVL